MKISHLFDIWVNIPHIPLPSLGQDEDMDTTPLGQNQPFFVIDKEGQGKDGGDAGNDSGQDEDPNCLEDDDDDIVEDEDDKDGEVSSTNKASTNQERIENGNGVSANGNHNSESEEDEDTFPQSEVDDITVRKSVKSLPLSAAPECQTVSSWPRSTSWRLSELITESEN